MNRLALTYGPIGLEMLERAIANYQALTGVLLAEAMHVWGTAGDT